MWRWMSVACADADFYRPVQVCLEECIDKTAVDWVDCFISCSSHCWRESIAMQVHCHHFLLCSVPVLQA